MLLEITDEGWRWKEQDHVCTELAMPRCYTEDFAQAPNCPHSPRVNAATFLCVVVPDQAHLEQLPNSIQRDKVINARFMDVIRKSGSETAQALPGESDAAAGSAPELQLCAISERQHAVYRYLHGPPSDIHSHTWLCTEQTLIHSTLTTVG